MAKKQGNLPLILARLWRDDVDRAMAMEEAAVPVEQVQVTIAAFGELEQRIQKWKADIEASAKT